MISRRFIDSSPKLTVLNELTEDKTLNDFDDFESSTQLNWQSLQKVLVEKTILLKNLPTFAVLSLRRLGFCFLLALSCQVKVIRQMVQTLFKESYKDKFDQLHHMQAIAHVLISLLLQYFNAEHVQHKLELLTSKPEMGIGNSQNLLVELPLLSMRPPD